MGNDSSRAGLSPTEVDDLKKQTVFSQREIKDWYTKFRADCPKGEMTKANLKNLYTTIFPNGDSTLFSEHVFHMYDKDGSGTIDFKEFICTISVASRGSIDEKLRWAFSMYDMDGNGYVTKKEVTEIFKAISKMKGPTPGCKKPCDDVKDVVQELFDHLDKDGDEKLSDVEFILGAKHSPAVLYLLDSDKTME